MKISKKQWKVVENSEKLRTAVKSNEKQWKVVESSEE